MRAHWVGFALVALALGATPSQAAEETSGRYTMERTDDGIVRLDTRTGAMSLCRRDDGRWSCEAMNDSQRVLRDENDRLEAENRSLKAQMEDMEETFGLGEKHAETPEAPQSHDFKLPSEQDVDKAFDYLEAMLKKLKERMEKLDEQQGSKGREL